jgi:hypothetical protein
MRRLLFLIFLPPLWQKIKVDGFLTQKPISFQSIFDSKHSKYLDKSVYDL